MRVSPGVGAVYLSPRGFDGEGRDALTLLGAATVASRLVGHVLAPVLPTLGIADAADAMRSHPAMTCTPVLGPVEDAVASHVLITDRMRELAVEVRRGTDTLEPTEKDVKIGERAVFVIEPCHYRNGSMRPVILTAWHQTVPIPVADRLVELGLCVSPGSREAEQLIEAKRVRNSNPNVVHTSENLSVDNTRSIGLDMAVWRAAELERLRAVWRAGLPN